MDALHFIISNKYRNNNFDYIIYHIELLCINDVKLTRILLKGFIFDFGQHHLSPQWDNSI